MISHVVHVLRGCVDEVIVVSSPSLELPRLEAEVVRDPDPHLGPLAGIATGLAASRAEWAFVTSTDAPFLTAKFVDALFAPGRAAAPIAAGTVQPLAAVYPRAAANAAQDLVNTGRRRPLHLLEELRYLALPIEALPDAQSLDGFNTPAEYLAAVARTFGPAAVAGIELLGRARRAVGRARFEVPVGSLGDVLAPLQPALSICDGERVSPAYLVSLGGRDFVRETRIPIGPGESVLVFDAAAGG